MKRITIIILVVAVAIAVIVFLKQSPAVSVFLWSVSNQGAWLLPLVLVSALLDSVHPCSFSILLITIAFLFGMQMTRKKILQIGGSYIAGIFAAYFLIGLGILKVLHLFNTPHFMGKLGAALLIGFGIINLINRFFNNILHHGAGAGKCITVKRTAFENIGGFREDLVFREDGDLLKRLSKIGRTCMDPQMIAYHSGRRLHRLGIARFYWLWFINGVYGLLFNHSRVKEWTPIR